MNTIRYKIVKKDNVDFLRNLCNELMKFQLDNAKVRPEIMKSMNYDNRLKRVSKGSNNEFMIVAYDDNKAIGFSYLDGDGFFPKGYNVPESIGTFKLLYVNKDYRGYNVGKELTTQTMSWLRNQNVDDLKLRQNI